MSLNGTDISGWQPGNPVLSGDAFSFVKATEGVGFINANWGAQCDSIRAAGVLLGHYHFANGSNSPKAEADYFWGVVKTKWRVGEPCALDIEGNFFANAANPVQWALSFAQEFFALSGLKVLIYIDWQHEKAATYNWTPLVQYNCGLWGAAYNNSGFGDPSPWPFVVVWQFADTNASGGDSDVLYGDANLWRAYGTPGGASPTTTEDPMFLAKLANADAVYISNGIVYRYIGLPATITTLQALGIVPNSPATVVASLDVLGYRIDQVASDVVYFNFPWHGFDGNVPTSGRTQTNLATDAGFGDARATGFGNQEHADTMAALAAIQTASAQEHTDVTGVDTDVKGISVTLTDAQLQTLSTEVAAAVPGLSDTDVAKIQTAVLNGIKAQANK